MVLKKLFFLPLFIFSLIATHAIAQVQTISTDSIIRRTIYNKTVNNPPAFEFTAYNKLIITADPDLIEGNIDSVFVTKRSRKIFSRIDSSDCVFKKIISKQHLYVTEKISKFRHSGQILKETILATRMAGFKEPIFEYFSLQLQPFSLYDDTYSLVEKEYPSPISQKGYRQYNYTYAGTVWLENRLVHKITFAPKKKTKTGKLEGILYLDSEKLSIAKAELKVNGLLRIKSNHDFKFDPILKNWFPSQASLLIKKGNSTTPIKIFGETITFEGTNPKLNPEGKKFASDFIEIQSDSKYYEPRFNSYFKLKHPDIAIEINETAIAKKENLWYTYFNDSTDVRSNPTYVSLDSLVEKRKIENKIRIGRKVIKGYYPIGFFDVDLRYLLRYNNYEGFRLGLGGITNDKLSKIFKMEGYYAYGTKDGIFKGYISNALRLNNHTETWLGVSYRDDVAEIANANFEIDKRSFKIYDPRPFNISTFYNHVTWRGFVETKIIPKTESIWQITQSNIIPKFNYQFEHQGQLYTDFRATIVTASLQWNPFSQYMQTPNGKIEIDKKFPKFTFQFSKTLPALWKNSFDFGKVDVRFDYQKKFNSNHKLSFLFEGGYAFGDIPITHVYNHSPNNLTKDKILQRITFAGKDSFETMYFNEFFSNKYAFLELEHQFPKWIISQKIKPVFSLATKYGIGALDNASQHKSIAFKTLEKGYMESGFELNQIYKGLGFVAFYRYGPNHMPHFEDNIALKLSVKIDLGFNN
ncbi:DUF5686 family protein [Flavobacterium humi]|uniref:Carboxypeptidase-like regulatory domain-containing protein n=1 Tax=Flavobacterium humi TaxID=2562683 RepID=A0A4Z0L806_9FLAO|nr:DUF5686 family protein [Flavobacterium humi]TGD57270.1 carboxypeptidase-like regulatory domain-containing protein [Flavobacterium humi]